MQEQPSWKGHAFTLMIFGGIVVLCSIFFVLGMLVGRTQSTKIAAVATAEAASKPQPAAELRDLYPDKQPEFEAEPAKPEPAPPPSRSAKMEEEPPVAAPASTVNLQVVALKNRAEAEKQVDELKKKGFRAFMLTPAPNDPNPFYRVQVGAADVVQAGTLKQKLEAAGFKPIVKK